MQLREQLKHSKYLNRPLSCHRCFDFNGGLDLEKIACKLSVLAQVCEFKKLWCPKPFEDLVVRARSQVGKVAMFPDSDAGPSQCTHWWNTESSLLTINLVPLGPSTFVLCVMTTDWHGNSEPGCGFRITFELIRLHSSSGWFSPSVQCTHWPHYPNRASTDGVFTVRYCHSSLDLTNFVARSNCGAAAENALSISAWQPWIWNSRNLKIWNPKKAKKETVRMQIRSIQNGGKSWSAGKNACPIWVHFRIICPWTNDMQNVLYFPLGGPMAAIRPVWAGVILCVAVWDWKHVGAGMQGPESTANRWDQVLGRQLGKMISMVEDMRQEQKYVLNIVLDHKHQKSSRLDEETYEFSFTKRSLRWGLLTGLVRGLERCGRAVVVHLDQEKPVLGSTCSCLAYTKQGIASSTPLFFTINYPSVTLTRVFSITWVGIPKGSLT